MKAAIFATLLALVSVANASPDTEYGFTPPSEYELAQAAQKALPDPTIPRPVLNSAAPDGIGAPMDGDNRVEPAASMPANDGVEVVNTPAAPVASAPDPLDVLTAQWKADNARLASAPAPVGSAWAEPKDSGDSVAFTWMLLLGAVVLLIAALAAAVYLLPFVLLVAIPLACLCVPVLLIWSVWHFVL